MKRKKIAFISEHASPLAEPGSIDSGGQNIYVSELAKELVKYGFDIDIFTRKDDSELPAIFNWLPHIRVIHVEAGPAVKIPKEELFAYMEDFSVFMQYFIKKQSIKYSLIHAHFWMSGWVALKLKAALQIPFVITFHALGAVRLQHQQQADRFPKERIQIERQIVKFADKVIAECPQDAEDLASLYYSRVDKTVIIPCGFNHEEFFPVDKQRARRVLHLDPDAKIILQLGRMVPRKGIDNVIEAMRFLRKKTLNNTKLVIVGGELKDMETCPEYQRLKRLSIAEGVDDNVIFAGAKARKLLKYYYSAADIFISTPWYEPFGITPLEAMACGTPVIGSNVGGIKYSVCDGDTGFLVPPKDPAALADKMDKLLNHDSLLKRMCDAAIMRVNSFFTWKKVAYKMADIYHEVEIARNLNMTIAKIHPYLQIKGQTNEQKSNILG